MIIEEGAAAFIAGLGVPGPVIGRCHAGGVKVISMCGTVEHARKRRGGRLRRRRRAGHRGGRPHRQGRGDGADPADRRRGADSRCSAAGSIVDGRGFVAALALGAQGIWMGTRFIASTEARAAQPVQGAHRRRARRRDRSSRAATRASRCASSPIPTSRSRSAIRRRSSAFPSSSMRSAMAGVMNYVDDAATDPERTCMPAGRASAASTTSCRPARSCARVLREARERRRRASGELA